MNINICSANVPPVNKPFRVFCFIAGGFLSKDGFADYYDDATVFDSLEDVQFSCDQICKFYELYIEDVGFAEFAKRSSINIHIQFIY